MVFCRNILPILVLFVAVNSRFGLALPHQSIRLDPSDVPFIYNLNASWTETCPGGETDCAPGETCCPLKNQGYGCCPYKDAVCCSDQLSCCPGGTQCNIIERICDPTNKDDAVTTAKELKEAQPIHIELTPIEDAIRSQIRKNPDKSGLCPDHKMQCPDGTTCCKLYDGGYGCCPYPQGVCCKDGAHCCPHATQCDIQHGRCIRSHFLPMLMGLPEFNDIDPPMEKVSMLSSTLSGGGGGMTTADSVEAVEAEEAGYGGTHSCPNPEDQCLDGQTCCQISEKDFGCCPFAEAVCCKDMAHCCPHNTSCDLESDTCVPKPANNVTTDTTTITPLEEDLFLFELSIIN